MKINMHDIHKFTQNEQAYKKGYQLYEEGAVKSFQYNQSLNAYYVLVFENNQKHEIIIYLDADKSIHRMQCDCIAYRLKKNVCPHLIAALIAIEASKQQNHIVKLSNTIAADGILNIPEMPLPDETHKIKVHVDLIISQDLEKKNLFNQYYLEFKIGLQKSYILKNIGELIEAIENYEDLYYGKDFTFQPDLHTFEPAFLKTLDFLKNLYELSGYGNLHFFEGKRIYLLPKQLKEVLSFWINKNITFKDRTLEVTDDRFNHEIALKLYSGAIIADVSDLKGIESLKDDDTLLADQEMLYLLDKKTADILHPFLEANKMGLDSVIFDQEKKDNFLKYVIPHLETIQTIPENIQNLYYKGRLKANLYLDKTATAIMVTVEFVYGQYAFNPFSTVDIPYLNGRVILRDTKKEQKIMRILEKAEFMVTPTNLYLDDDEKIRTFIFEYLPHLQPLLDVFYSDTFKQIVEKKTLTSHIRLNEQINLFEVDFDLNSLSYPEFKKILESYHLNRHYYRLKDGSFLDLDDEKTKQTLQMAEDLHIDKNNFHQGQVTLPLNRAFYLNEYFGQQLSKDDAFQNFIQRFNAPIPEATKLPNGLNGSLRDYQIVGFQWLKTLAYYGLGGILADDMGLGKTLQTITYILDYKNTYQKGCHLVVCPTSLVFNWQEELTHFAPSLKYKIISGSQTERSEKILSLKDEKVDVVITSFPLLRRDVESYQNITFETIVLDEAQYIKNATSLNAQATKKINAKIHFALTGTPIENSLAELWSIFDFILPDYFSSHHYFRNKYERPILKEQDTKASALLQKQIQPFILRRMKKDVLSELPDKIETRIPIQMTAKQKEVYFSYLLECQRVIDSDIRSFGFNETRFEILSRLTHLRQLCDHPKLFLKDYDGQSTKLITLIELLREALDGGHRVLVFSQFTGMLKLIKEELEHLEMSYYYLDGNTKMDERGQLVKDFNQGKRSIFLISLKAGGTGLNLVGADMVIHVDPWWNPAVENQATDRAYRIGQNQTVQVIKLITAHSIEEKIFELQERKKDLVNAIITPGENFLTHLSENEIIDLFNTDYR